MSAVLSLAVALSALLPPGENVEPAAVAPLAGYASTYAEGVFEDTLAYRFRENVWRVAPPWDWYYRIEGYVAVGDCGRVGEIATLAAADGEEYTVLIADCAGNDGTPQWMEINNIVVEIDPRLYGILTAAHGRPLRVELSR